MARDIRCPICTSSIVPPTLKARVGGTRIVQLVSCTHCVGIWTFNLGTTVADMTDCVEGIPNESKRTAKAV